MSLVTLLGKYRGPSGLIRVFQEDGRTKAEYKGKGGGRAGFEGVLLEGGKSLKGFWYNYDEDVTPANRFECTCVVALEGAHGETMKLVGKKKGGGEESWEAKRWSERDVPRADGKITSFAFKDKAIFDRVSDNGFAKKQAWVETAREKMMEESVPRPNFDGSSSYIPPPAVGSEYMTQHEVDRLLKKKDEEHRLEVMANLEKRIEKLAAAGDDAKAKLETAKKLLKGEKQWDTLNERKPWCNGAGPFLPQSSKWPEHLPDEYRTEMEVMRALNKEELKQPERDKEKLEKEIPALEAKIAAGTGDVDMMKRRLEVARKLLKGVAGLGKLAERPDFKPPNVKVETAGSKPAEHMPDQYLSVHDLPRKLAADAKAADEASLAKLQKAVETLAAKAAAGSIDDLGKRKLETGKKLLKGAKGSEKLQERKKFKLSAGDATGQRLSSSIMFHPSCVRAALKG